MQITRGRILAQRFFDVAEEVNLPYATALVKELSQRTGFVGSAKHIQLPKPPVEMSLPRRPCGLPNAALSDVMVRIYDVGALVVTFAIELPPNCDPEQLIALAIQVEAAQDAITEAARPVANEIAHAISKACRAGGVSDVIEDYTIFYLQQTSPNVSGAALLEHLDVARLLLGEKDRVAESERRHLLHAAFSYKPDDLVIIDWNSAIVLDPQGALDVPELLELTTVQLLELRAYDIIVGRALDHLYDELTPQTMSFWQTQSGKYQVLSRRIMQRYIELSEIADRIDNSLKFLGDTYLARLHRAAMGEFAIPHWHKTLRDRLEVLRQINEMLVSQVTSSKSLRVEVAIVALIVLEILLATFKVY